MKYNGKEVTEEFVQAICIKAQIGLGSGNKMVVEKVLKAAEEVFAELEPGIKYIQVTPEQQKGLSVMQADTGDREYDYGWNSARTAILTYLGIKIEEASE